MEEARNTILKEALHDFKGRGLSADDLRQPYEGLTTKKLKRICAQNGINEIDYDLAIKELENENLIGSGPMDVADPPKISGVTILPWVYSKREYVFLKEKGYKEASKKPSQRTGRSMVPAVVHGDQFINYGQAAAMGSKSVGTINYHQQWGAIQNQVDLGALVQQFDQAIQEKRHSASSSEDYQELGLLAQAKEHAEKRNGSKLLETLTKIGESVVPVLAKAGAEGLVQ